MVDTHRTISLSPPHSYPFIRLPDHVSYAAKPPACETLLLSSIHSIRLLELTEEGLHLIWTAHCPYTSSFAEPTHTGGLAHKIASDLSRSNANPSLDLLFFMEVDDAVVPEYSLHALSGEEVFELLLALERSS